MIWNPIVVLPNINVINSFETERVAITSANNKRIDSHPHRAPLEIFLSKFVNQHGNSIRPSVIWWNASSNDERPELDAICNFRDAVAISYLTHDRTKYLVGNAQLAHIVYGDYFAFYPWMLAADGTCLTYNIPLSGGMHEISSFQGQSLPGVPFRNLRDEYDWPLFAALKTRWTALWNYSARCWKDIALFRSLNMAYAASVMPSGTQPATFYDYGRAAALWVSAFEILSRENPNDDAGWKSVYKLLHRVPYLNDKAVEEKYMAYDGRKASKQKQNISCWLYGELNHARNDFLHGNDVQSDRLTIAASQRNLQDFAAPLYRIALTGFLDLRWEKRVSHSIGADCDQFYFDRPQRDAESALLLSHRTSN